MSLWRILIKNVSPVWVVLVLVTSIEARSYLETNEVVERPSDHSEDLPACTPNSICGYLQANSRGINSQRRCACEAGSTCSMMWDSTDGHTIQQGSDQYKYCGAAPTLSMCRDLHTAYTSRIVYSKLTDEIIVKSDRAHCICPDTHNYVLTNQHFEDPDEETEAMELTYICSALPQCELGEYCKTLSQTSSQFLVNRKCECPDGFRCPSETSTGIKTEIFGNGLVHLIRCQR